MYQKIDGRLRFVGSTPKHYTEEEMSLYKIYEIVSVRGVEATIRDIYARTFRYTDENGDEQFGRHLSYRLHEPEWKAMDIAFEELTKLDGKINFEASGVKYKTK